MLTIKNLHASIDEDGKEILTLSGHSQEVMSVAFSANGMSALTSSQDGAAILWVAENWREEVPAAGE